MKLLNTLWMASVIVGALLALGYALSPYSATPVECPAGATARYVRSGWLCVVPPLNYR